MNIVVIHMEAKAGEKHWDRVRSSFSIGKQELLAISTSPTHHFSYLALHSLIELFVFTAHFFLRSQFVLLIFIYLLVAGPKLFTYHVLNKCYITKYKNYCNPRYLQPGSSEQDPIYVGCSKLLLFMIESLNVISMSLCFQNLLSSPQPNQTLRL